MNKIFVLGSVNCDFVINTPKMPRGGETVSGGAFFTNAGGKGANQAVACAKQKADTYFIGKVGGDGLGRELADALKSYGVDTSYLKTAAGRSGAAFIIVENGENRIILDGGVNLEITSAQIDEALLAADCGDVFIAQLENNFNAVAYGLRAAKQKGMITVFNPAPAVKLGAETLDYTHYLIFNESECEIITGVYPALSEDAKRARAALGYKGIKAVIVTLGSRGAICCEGEEVYSVPALEVRATDTTAAGDTFVGAFACKIKDGDGVKSALKYASICAALACTKTGAQQSIPTRDEVVAFLG